MKEAYDYWQDRPDSLFVRRRIAKRKGEPPNLSLFCFTFDTVSTGLRVGLGSPTLRRSQAFSIQHSLWAFVPPSRSRNLARFGFHLESSTSTKPLISLRLLCWVCLGTTPHLPTTRFWSDFTYISPQNHHNIVSNPSWFRVRQAVCADLPFFCARSPLV